MRLLYITPVRFPTEKAHGLQIAQNCEAFANAGWDVRLWAAWRWNTPDMRKIGDVFAYYGVEANFQVMHIPTLDLMPLAFKNRILERIAFYIQQVTFILMVLLRLVFVRPDVVYSRDPLTVLILSYVLPRHKIAYEAHTISPSGRGQALERRVVQRAGSIIAITPHLRNTLIERGAVPERVIVAHDGIRAARFADVPDQKTARKRIGWHEDAFIVGFVGRLHMMGQDKGVATLVEALSQVEGVSLGLVGGPDEMAAQLRDQWVGRGLDAGRFLYAGHVLPAEVPLYLSAFDVCVMPHPFTEQYAYYTSPLKLFEYMAARRAIIASDLPGWADVVRDEVSALLFPPSDAAALAGAIRRLQADPILCNHLAETAYAAVMQRYTWAARARMIRDHIQAIN